MTLKPRQYPHLVHYCHKQYNRDNILIPCCNGENTTAEIASSSYVLLVKHYNRESILIMCPFGDYTAAMRACSSHVLTASLHQSSNVHSLNDNTSVFFICRSSSNKLHSLSDLHRTLLVPCIGMPVAFLCTSHSQSNSNNSVSPNTSSVWSFSCSK